MNRQSRRRNMDKTGKRVNRIDQLDAMMIDAELGNIWDQALDMLFGVGWVGGCVRLVLVIGFGWWARGWGDKRTA